MGSWVSPQRVDEQVAEDADYLREAWPLLVELGLPEAGSSGRSLPRSARRVSERARERAAFEELRDRVEARKAGYVRPGEHPVPVDVPLLDLLAEFVRLVAEVAEYVTQAAGVERLAEPESCWVDPRPYLAATRAHLAAADEAEPGAREWAARLLHGLADKVAARLGEVHDGQVLAALCPWCRGRTERAPAGGELTLVIFHRQSRRRQAGRYDGGPDAAPDPEPLIVCRGVSCTPPDSDVGVWVDGRPAWPMREWDWLAKRLLPSPGTARS